MKTKDEIIGAIVALMSLFILLMFVKVTLRASNPNSLENWADVCSQSVATIVRFSVKHILVVLPSQLRCPTKYFTVKNDGVYYNKAKWMGFSRDKKKVMEKALAYDLYSCWKPFSSNNFINEKYDYSFCIVCSDWYLEDSARGTNLDDFVNYLNTTTIPGSKATFYSYLTSANGLESYDYASFDPSKASQKGINLSSQDYAIVVYYSPNTRNNYKTLSNIENDKKSLVFLHPFKLSDLTVGSYFKKRGIIFVALMPRNGKELQELNCNYIAGEVKKS